MVQGRSFGPIAGCMDNLYVTLLLRWLVWSLREQSTKGQFKKL
uniref:Uncharacterized protein n=1 Tax=Arundo donax TaxID=35708 RepID=A0A0A9GRG0_ARUDO